MTDERNPWEDESENARKKYEKKLLWRTSIAIAAYDLSAFGAPIWYAFATGDNSKEKAIGALFGCGIGLLATLVGNPVIQALTSKKTNRDYKDYCERAEVKYLGRLGSGRIRDYIFPD